MHGDFNIPIMSGTLTSRNSSMNSVVYGGVQQQIGNVPSGRFASNNIPIGLSQISHGSSHGEYSRVANRGGLGVSPFLGCASPRATSSMRNIMGSGNIGMFIGSDGGLYIPGLASHLNLSANNGSGSLDVRGPSRLNNGVLQQGGNSDYGMDFQQKEQIHDNGVPMLSQHFPMGRSPGFNLGEMYSSNHPQQQQQQQQHTLSGSLPSGTSLTSINTPGGVSNIGSYEQQFMHPYQYQQIQLQFPLQQMQSINQTNRDLAIRQIQSQQPNPDPYGFEGLLSVIRMSDCDLTLLALGIDLTNMRLDINLSENGHETCFTLV